MQEDYLECMRQRLDGILSEAESLAGSSGAEPKAAWGYSHWQDLTLPAFVVELDQRFITELARVAAAFTQLFEQQGRSRLVQVRSPVIKSAVPQICPTE